MKLFVAVGAVTVQCLHLKRVTALVAPVCGAKALRTALVLSSSNVEASGYSTLLPIGAVGEADRAFRQGIDLERSGQFRAASAAFHEAATLYQCFLDHHRPDDDDGTESGRRHYNEFGHVTHLTPTAAASTISCPSVLAYTCLRLAHLNHDALGDSKAAIRLYKEAATIDPNPSFLAFDGIGTSIEASSGGRRLDEAVADYREALRLAHSLQDQPHHYNTIGVVEFHLAVALERLESINTSSNGQSLKGDEEEEESEAGAIFEKLRRSEAILACLVDSWGYIRWHTRRSKPLDLNLHRGTREMLQIGLDAVPHDLLQKDKGLVCEFGVASGRSLRMMQDMLPLTTPIYGFDTFTGLPIAWGSDTPAGSYSTGGMVPTNMEGRVYFHKGLFKVTIPAFLSTLSQSYQPLAFANMDCDLYGSTLDVLEAMHGRVVPGTVFVFDEYLGHATWRQDEFRAWRECCKRFGWQYEYLAFSLSSKQVVVRVTFA